MKEVRERQYIAIDLKSFYASVECMDLGRDPLTTNLVVADRSRTEKTICLAVSPSLKSFGIPGRPRLFEVVAKIREVNAKRRNEAGVELGLDGQQENERSSDDYNELMADPSLMVDYLVIPPHMARYMEVSTKIYSVYLQFVSTEDIFPYSIDEVFIDATAYLDTYRCTARELAERMIKSVLKETGITAAAGVGTNLFLAKVAMDVTAKHVSDGEFPVAELDEYSYRRQIWPHRPITDIWRVGRGYAKKLAKYNILTMGDIARVSETEEGERLLHDLFGVNAELLIDHAWGYEPVTLADVKAYEPETHSVGSGQVLMRPYSYEEARLITMEMMDLLALDLVDKGLVTDAIVITINYDIENLADGSYKGPVVTDYYGRKAPKPAHGTENLEKYTNSGRMIMDAAKRLFDRIVDPKLSVRRVNIVAEHTVREAEAPRPEDEYEQLDLFTDHEKIEREREQQERELARERNMQKAVLDIKKKFGKNAVLKGMNLQEGGMTIERNRQIGGHKA